MSWEAASRTHSGKLLATLATTLQRHSLAVKFRLETLRKRLEIVDVNYAFSTKGEKASACKASGNMIALPGAWCFTCKL